VKERLKELWTEGKRINRAALKRRTERLLKREIRYISSFFPYDIKRFHHEDLIYMQAVLLADSFSGRDAGGGLSSRLVSLITGLELLSIGTVFHDFNRYGSCMPAEESASTERGYTLDLLFGDIFYSRAVIYLLKFRDHEVFDSILEALKKMHESRLKLHLAMQKALSPGGDTDCISRDKKLLIDANSLLYISVATGIKISGRSRMLKDRKLSNIVEDLLAYKTYSDLLKYLMSPGPSGPSSVLSGCLAKRAKSIIPEMEGNIAGLKEKDLSQGINMIFDSLKKNHS